MKNGISMEIIIDKYNKYNRALEKAKVKYKDAVRGRDYQDELLLNKRGWIIGEIEEVEFRRRKFQTEICLLEETFSAKELNNEILK